MPKTEFDYYYGAESEQFSFIMIPQILLDDEEHFGSLSNDARMLYGILLNRMQLSRRNHWVDADNRVYIIYPMKKMAKRLKASLTKTSKVLQELDDENGVGLVKKIRRGQGKPSILYVKNFILKDYEYPEPEYYDDDDDFCEEDICDWYLEEDTPISRNTENDIQEIHDKHFKKSKMQISKNPKMIFPEIRKMECSNNNISNKDLSYIENQSIHQSRAAPQNFSPGTLKKVENYDGLIDGIDRNAVEEEVKVQIDYDCLVSHQDSSVVQMAEEIKDLMVDVLCGERSVVSEGKRVSEETAKAAYRKITFEHVQYVMQSLVSYPDKISRIDRFLTTSLFNSVYTLTNSTFAGFEHDMGMKLL